MARRPALKSSRPPTSSLGSLAPAERSHVLGALLVAHPELNEEAESIAQGLLMAVSVDQVASEVEAALRWISLDSLAARAGRVRGRGYVHETEAAWELVDEAMEPFRSDLDRRSELGLADPAAILAVGIVAGVYRSRKPEEGSVLAYAGEDTPVDLASEFLDRAERLGVTIPADAGELHWPGWPGLW